MTLTYINYMGSSMLLHTDPELRAPLHSLVEARGETTHFQPIFSVRRKAWLASKRSRAAWDRGGDRIAPDDSVSSMAAAEERFAARSRTGRRESAVRIFTRLARAPRSCCCS